MVMVMGMVMAMAPGRRNESVALRVAAMTLCYVPGCKNRTRCPTAAISFHRQGPRASHSEFCSNDK